MRERTTILWDPVGSIESLPARWIPAVGRKERLKSL
jgi:hypothetical protein